MLQSMTRRSAFTGLTLLAATGAPAQAQQQGVAPDSDWRRTISSVLGKPGTEMPGGVYRVALPRTDLHVTLDGVEIRPGFGLGSWLAFHEHGRELVVMGDLVLLEREIGPVMRRLRDPRNYYIARANALEDNVRLYRVVEGRRIQFAGAGTPVPRDRWQALGLRVEGDRLAVSLDGRELFAATDRTFAEPDRVGLWTKADSMTHFDALEVELPR